MGAGERQLVEAIALRQEPHRTGKSGVSPRKPVCGPDARREIRRLRVDLRRQLTRRRVALEIGAELQRALEACPEKLGKMAEVAGFEPNLPRTKLWGRARPYKLPRCSTSRAAAPRSASPHRARRCP